MDGYYEQGQQNHLLNMNKKNPKPHHPNKNDYTR